jgi:hypothetical protein
MVQAQLVPGRACEHCKLEITSCKGCGEEILFGQTEKGATIPLDAKVTRIYARAGSHVPVLGHRSHFETCTKREAFKS